MPRLLALRGHREIWYYVRIIWDFHEQIHTGCREMDDSARLGRKACSQSFSGCVGRYAGDGITGQLERVSTDT